jgi:hypothetical protein
MYNTLSQAERTIYELTNGQHANKGTATKQSSDEVVSDRGPYMQTP